jgi:hypothetical protein
MELKITHRHFGGVEELERFVEETLQEINKIEENYQKNSIEPNRFLGDGFPRLFPRLFTLKIILETFQRKVKEEKDKIVFEI